MRYRIGQFLASLWPRVERDERAILIRWLPPRAVDLFYRMPRRDQRHSLDVLYSLRSAGVDQPDLLAAALLHDVGKTVNPGRPLRLWQRVVVVLLEAIDPELVAVLASDDPDSLRYPFHAHLCHPELGAALAQEAGCTRLTVELIRWHQSKKGSPVEAEPGRQPALPQLLAWLQAADNVN